MINLCLASRSSRLGNRLQRQGYLLPRLKAALKKFYGRHHDIIDRFDVSVSQMTRDMFTVRDLVCGDIETGATRGSGDAYSFRNT